MPRIPVRFLPAACTLAVAAAVIPLGPRPRSCGQHHRRREASGRRGQSVGRGTVEP